MTNINNLPITNIEKWDFTKSDFVFYIKNKLLLEVFFVGRIKYNKHYTRYSKNTTDEFNFEGIVIRWEGNMNQLN